MNNSDICGRYSQLVPPHNKLRPPIVQDIQHLLHHFEEVKFVFSNREGNRVADRIAQEALIFQIHDTRLYSIVPMWLNPLVDAEKM